MITFYCSNCGTKITAEPEYAGAAANCPSCSHDLVVPGQAAQPSTDQTPTSSPPPIGAQPQAIPRQAGKADSILIVVKKLKGLLSKKWAIPGCAVLGLVLLVPLCTGGDDDEPEEYDVEAAIGQEAARMQGVLNSQRGNTCRSCKGTGQNGLTGCPSCKTMFDEFAGQGTVKTPSGHVIVCTRCNGSGTVPLPCSSCGGRGAY
jgi:DNA-directed RNA polymerase subunit RPC12/RpoP